MKTDLLTAKPIFTNTRVCPLQRWQKLMNSARKQLRGQEWECAVRNYLLAYHLAEEHFLSSEANSQQGLQRYLRTTIEFVYALRQNRTAFDFNAFASIIKFNLTSAQLDIPLFTLLKPFYDIAFAPRHLTKEWMDMLFAMDEQSRSTIH